MTQMRQENRRCGSKKMSQMKIPQKTISIQLDRSQNFARFKMPDGNTTVILQGKKTEIESVTSEDPYLTASIKDFPENRPEQTDTEFLAILESIKELAIQIIKESPNIPTEATFAIKNIESQSS
jgi:ATP-dependent Lon protease